MDRLKQMYTCVYYLCTSSKAKLWKIGKIHLNCAIGIANTSTCHIIIHLKQEISKLRKTL